MESSFNLDFREMPEQCLTELRESIIRECKKVARLPELSAIDRQTKYRKAEEALKRNLAKLASIYLSQAMLRGFAYRTDAETETHKAVLELWNSDAFDEMKTAAADALPLGDYVAFFTKCEEIRDAVRQIVLGLGGKEDMAWEVPIAVRRYA